MIPLGLIYYQSSCSCLSILKNLMRFQTAQLTLISTISIQLNLFLLYFNSQILLDKDVQLDFLCFSLKVERWLLIVFFSYLSNILYVYTYHLLLRNRFGQENDLLTHWDLSLQLQLDALLLLTLLILQSLLLLPQFILFL